MLSLVDVLDNQYVVFDLERVGIQLLATNVADANIDVITALRVRNTANQLRLAIEKYELDAALDVKEGDATHCTAMADVPRR